MCYTKRVKDADIIYFDHAAATPIDARVLREMQPYFMDLFYNPSSPYAPAVEVRRIYASAKHSIAQQIGAKPTECVVTAGATESIALSMTATTGGNIVSSSIEHPAVLEMVRSRNGIFIEPTVKGIIAPEAVEAAITDTTELVSIGLANSELGTVQPIRDIAQVVKKVRKRRQASGDMRPLWFHTDASQGVGQVDCNVARLGVDMMTINAGKIYGPKQVALLWRRPEIRLSPLFVGGGQENGLRSGTENVAGVVGMAKALELACEHRKAEAKRLSTLRDAMQNAITDAFSECIVSGSIKRRLPGHLHVSFPGIDAERLVFMLESKGVLVATGSACAANKGTRSHVLEAIKMNEDEADGSLRITLGRLTTDDAVRRGTDAIIDAVKKEQKRMGI